MRRHKSILVVEYQYFKSLLHPENAKSRNLQASEIQLSNPYPQTKLLGTQAKQREFSEYRERLMGGVYEYVPVRGGNKEDIESPRKTSIT
jgi:hypothetical protein